MQTMTNPIKPTLLVLAAGMGSRSGGLKPIEPVRPNGEAIVEYSLYDALRAGFGRIVFIIRRDIDHLVRHELGARLEKHFAVEYLYQELTHIPTEFRVPAGRIKPWGTTHAVLTAAGSVHEPFATINVNDFYGAESFRMLAHHLQSGTSDYATVGLVLRNTLSDFGAVARGVCQVQPDGYLSAIVDLKNIERQDGHALDTDAEGRETRLTGDEIVSMNMWGFTPQVFTQLSQHFQQFLQVHGAGLESECFLPNTVNALIVSNQARVKVLRGGDSWFGVTYSEDHARAVDKVRRLVEAGYYPRKLW
jgi:Nucleotidyl transferase